MAAAARTGVSRIAIPWLLLLLAAAPAGGARAMEQVPAWRLGVGLGRERQEVTPLRHRGYDHDAALVKLVAARPLLARGRASVELTLEPFVAMVHHRLRNPWFVGPSTGPDYLARRARFTAGETYREYGMEVGLSARWRAAPRLDLVAMASVGPMIGDAATERQARGFAFSDVAALGLAYRGRALTVELRGGVRHVSNAYLQLPNAGHNAAFALVAVTRQLDP